MEAIKRELQHLPGLARSVEQLTQNMAKMMQEVEETRKVVAALSITKMGPNRKQ